MKRTPPFTSLALGLSMVLSACLGGTDLVPSSTGGTTTNSGVGGSTTGLGGATTTSTAVGGGTTSSMGGATTTNMGGGGATSSSSTTTTSSNVGGGGSMSTGGGGGGTTTTTTSSGTGGEPPVGDPPCEVLAYFERKCWNCHATKPHSETGLALVTYQDLTAISEEDATKTNAERSIITMTDPLDPMPPGASPWATPAELSALQAWIDAGYPVSSCGDLAKDPYAAQPTCTSGVMLDPNGEEGEEMNPGRPCNDCHQQQNSEMGTHAPIYNFAGTIYPSAHEPDECAGELTLGAEIEVVDANGKVFVTTANAVGNFFFEDPEHSFKPPYKTRVVFQGRERWMDTPETEGDCNKCHTQAGSDDAPGRILLP